MLIAIFAALLAFHRAVKPQPAQCIPFCTSKLTRTLQQNAAQPQEPRELHHRLATSWLTQRTTKKALP